MRKAALTQKQKKHALLRKLLIRLAAYIAGFVAVVLLGYFCVSYFGCQTVIIDQSMNSMLQNEDVVLVNKLSYKIGSPKRMDIVTMQIGSSDSSPSYVRRVIGIPGDTVQIRNGKLYINDEETEITFNSDPIENAGTAEEGVTLGDDEYFVICDDYNNFRDDSRLDSIGTISSEQINGKVWFRISPVSKIGFIK